MDAYEQEIETIKAMEREIEARIAAMSDDQRQHLRALMYEFIKCYDKDAKSGAVIIIGNGETIDDIATLNCDRMEAARLMQATNDFFGFVNTMDAPPKEMFN